MNCAGQHAAPKMSCRRVSAAHILTIMFDLDVHCKPGQHPAEQSFEQMLLF